MKKIVIVIAAAAGLGTPPAQAQLADWIRGPYLGVGVARADREMNMPGATDTSGNGWKSSGKVFGGLQFDDTFGAELGYTDFRRSTLTYTINNAPGRITARGESWYLAGKATAPMNEQFSLYGKLGISHNKWKQSGAGSGTNLFRQDSDTEGYLAVGGEWRFSQRMGVSLEYERYGKTKAFGPKPNVWSLNATYRF